MSAMGLDRSRILLVIGGGIAAYKTLELIRRLRERGASVRAVMTPAACHFVTPLSVSALTGGRVHQELFDPDGEHDIGHIRLAREADLVVVAPATADILARMAHGLVDDLATAILLAAETPILVAPAMNPSMWSHPATQRNVDRLRGDGVVFVGPDSGEMAESGEAGIGRLAEPAAILDAVAAILDPEPVAETSRVQTLLSGLKAVVTSGPTEEPIDPVRYIANRSSGRQGQAVAAALAAAGAEVTLVSGPVHLAYPAGMRVVPVRTALEMRDAVEANLPADIAVMAAAVADWRVQTMGADKIKKNGKGSPTLSLVENPDILAGLARGPRRPRLVVGFAAETNDVVANAQAKLDAKGCDWIVANDVSASAEEAGGVPGGAMGGERNRVHLVTRTGVEDWPEMSKTEVAARLVARIAAAVGALGPAGDADEADDGPGVADPAILDNPAADESAPDEPIAAAGLLDVRPVL